MIHPILLGSSRRELLHLEFPYLVKCSLRVEGPDWNSTDTKDTLASFLLRHPALECLEVRSMDNFPSAVVRIPLPHLRYLRSQAGIVSSIVTQGLMEARLSWYTSAQETTDVEGIIVALKSMTRRDIPFVSRNENCNRTCYPQIVDSISRNMPHTKALSLRVISPLQVGFLPCVRARKLTRSSSVYRMRILSISASV
jgi:hypothetical protein